MQGSPMTTQSSRETDRAAERWLRRHGLPYFVKRSERSSRLTARIAPYLVFALALDLLSTTVVDITIDEESSNWDWLWAIVVVLIIAAAIAVPVVLGLLSARFLRDRPHWRMPVSLVVIGLFVVVDPLIVSAVEPSGSYGRSLLEGAAQNLVVVALAYLLTWLGIGSLLSWAALSAFRQLSALGQLATRALPLLMLVVVFAFFARALWEVTSTMDANRILWVAAFFLVLGLLFTIPIIRREMGDLDERIAPEERATLLAGTGVQGLGVRGNQAGPPLSRLERFNLATVMVLAQGFQVLIFAVLVCIFLIVLGSIAFSPAVLTSWLGGRLVNAQLLGVDLPVQVALVKTAIFLSCVSSLNFLVSVSTGAAYRAAFYDPLLLEARVALSVRGAYLSGDQGAAALQEPAVQDTASDEI
jgi:hypothetical protein